MKDPIYETIFRIKQARQDLADACLNGVDSWERYTQIVGRGQGLQETLDIIDQILQEDEERLNEYRK